MTAPSETRIPVTIVTGFLGSGKTTLVNRILRGTHGRRIAVIENELGEAGIDGEILLQEPGETIVEMNNGCICCTVRGDLVRILGSLDERRRAGALDFERVVIETTGLADPGPVAQTFFLEDDVRDAYRLDGIVTLVDSKHGAHTLSAHREAQRQVGFADRLLVSKTDLAQPDETRALIERLGGINARAKVGTAVCGDADITDILDVGGFELDAARDLENDLAPHDHGHAHALHSDEIASFVHREPRPFDLEKLEQFLGLLVDTYGADLLRYKGVLNVHGRDERIIFQGVQTLLGSEPGRRWTAGEDRASTLVFIGRGLPRAAIGRGLASCVAGCELDPAAALRAAS